jgi:23S rRNA (uracil1939-C5)-methyltransferase
MSRMAAQGEKLDVVFMDPPRSGSTEEFIHSVAEAGPRKVVYISCGPETLARDLKIFARNGYRAREAWGVDLFPWTGHVEVVTCLQRVDM